MRRFRGVAALGVLLLAACEIQPTPANYVDRQTPVAAERDAAISEIQDRIHAMGQALNRGNPTEAFTALSPAPDAYILGPDRGLGGSGPERIAALLGSMMEGSIPVELRDVTVSVGPRADVAWFRAEFALPGRMPDDVPIRMTGVYIRDAGVWMLEQAHVSIPLSAQVPADSSSRAASAADSAARE